MRNFEKFEKEIFRITNRGQGVAFTNNRIVGCDEVNCSYCAWSYENNDKQGCCSARRMLWLYSEYVEKPKLTKQERKFCELFEDKDLWFARQRNMTMPTIFMHKPDKTTTCWHGDTIPSCELRKYCNARLDFIKWEDEEPWSVEDLLELEVEE